MNDSVSTAPVTHNEWWAKACTKAGKIINIVEGYPPGEVAQNEFLLTREEFYFLKSLLPLHSDITSLHRLVHRIQKKLSSVSNLDSEKPEYNVTERT